MYGGGFSGGPVGRGRGAAVPAWMADPALAGGAEAGRRMGAGPSRRGPAAAALAAGDRRGDGAAPPGRVVRAGGATNLSDGTSVRRATRDHGNRAAARFRRGSLRACASTRERARAGVGGAPPPMLGAGPPSLNRQPPPPTLGAGPPPLSRQPPPPSTGLPPAALAALQKAKAIAAAAGQRARRRPEAASRRPRPQEASRRRASRARKAPRRRRAPSRNYWRRWRPNLQIQDRYYQFWPRIGQEKPRPWRRI